MTIGLDVDWNERMIGTDHCNKQLLLFYIHIKHIANLMIFRKKKFIIFMTHLV